MGLIKGAPYPTDPPYLGGWGQNIFGGVITDGPFRPQSNQIFWEALDSNIISVMLQESPDPLSPYPPRPLYGGPLGGPGGSFMRGVI